jgi:hypothetical protein
MIFLSSPVDHTDSTDHAEPVGPTERDPIAPSLQDADPRDAGEPTWQAVSPRRPSE